MTNNKNMTSSGTNIQHVKQQNVQSAGAQSSGQYGTEFSSQTDTAQVKKLNQQAEAKKAQASGQYGQNSQQ
ncbi:MAG: gamma-type small acid-soluble spore protein [Bacillus sp. (in: firmicutes)]